MLNLLPSARRIRRLNRRQGKKLRVGEFQEPVFEVSEVIGPLPQIVPKKHVSSRLWQGGMRRRGRPK